MRDNIVNVFGSKLADGLVPLAAETPGGSKLEGSDLCHLTVIMCLEQAVPSACKHSQYTHRCVHCSVISACKHSLETNRCMSEWPALASLPKHVLVVLRLTLYQE